MKFFNIFLFITNCVLLVSDIAATNLLRAYSKNKLELESNLSEILPVNCNFMCS